MSPMSRHFVVKTACDVMKLADIGGSQDMGSTRQKITNAGSGPQGHGKISGKNMIEFFRQIRWVKNKANKH